MTIAEELKAVVRAVRAKMPFRAAPTWEDVHAMFDALIEAIEAKGAPVHPPANDQSPPGDTQNQG